MKEKQELHKLSKSGVVTAGGPKIKREKKHRVACTRTFGGSSRMVKSLRISCQRPNFIQGNVDGNLQFRLWKFVQSPNEGVSRRRGARTNPFDPPRPWSRESACGKGAQTKEGDMIRADRGAKLFFLSTLRGSLLHEKSMGAASHRRVES